MKFNSDYYPKQLGFIALSALVLIPLLTGSCKEKNGSSIENQAASVAPDTLPGDFVTFFNRFHEDSAYQMEHILFPLEGLPPTTGDGDTATITRYFWQKADWKKHNRFTDPGHNFEQWYEVPNDRFVEHWIQMKGTNLYMKRRFAKLKDEWYLIYYQGMRPVDRESKRVRE